MSTQRPNKNHIISSDPSNKTRRSNLGVISSGVSTIPSDALLPNSTLKLNGINYKVVKSLAKAGESEIILVKQYRKQIVFKHYYTQFHPKKQVLEKIESWNHPGIVKLLDYGIYNGRSFELLEYAKGGTLLDIAPITTFIKTKEIVEKIVDALNFCHENGVIHRDIKPSNIFIRDLRKNSIAIGDFGISSHFSKEEELIKTTYARTSLYAAPEIFHNIDGKTMIDKSSDYYALGMTLLHLWFENSPFENLSEFEIMRMKMEGKILFPQYLDTKVKNLIQGLLTLNPAKRWGYDEVTRWLNNETVSVYSEISYASVPNHGFTPYKFDKTNLAHNPQELVQLLLEFPSLGKKHLYRNTISDWVKNVDQNLYHNLMDIVENEYPNDMKTGLQKAIYFLDPQLPYTGIDNTDCHTLEEIAVCLENNFSHYKEALKSNDDNLYLYLEARGREKEVKDFKKHFNDFNSELALNTVILTLEGGVHLNIEGTTIKKPKELLNLPSDSKNRVISQLQNPDSKLSLWLMQFPNLNISLYEWISLGDFNEITLPHALNEGIFFNEIQIKNTNKLKSFLEKNLPFLDFKEVSKFFYEYVDPWLKNYCNTTLIKRLESHLKNSSTSFASFKACLNLALGLSDNVNHSITHYLPLIKTQIEQTNNPNIELQKIIDEFIYDRILEKWYLNENIATKNLSSIQNYFRFFTDNYRVYSNFIYELTEKLSSFIIDCIHKDLTGLKIVTHSTTYEPHWNMSDSVRFIPYEKLVSYFEFIKETILEFEKYFTNDLLFNWINDLENLLILTTREIRKEQEVKAQELREAAILESRDFKKWIKQAVHHIRPSYDIYFFAPIVVFAVSILLALVLYDNYNNIYPYLHGGFSAFLALAITAFGVYKGIKNTEEVRTGIFDFIETNMPILYRVFKVVVYTSLYFMGGVFLAGFVGSLLTKILINKFMISVFFIILIGGSLLNFLQQSRIIEYFNEMIKAISDFITNYKEREEKAIYDSNCEFSNYLDDLLINEKIRVYLLSNAQVKKELQHFNR